MPPSSVECLQLAEQPLHVMHIAVEMAPICKVGGLGDVVTALGRAVKELGHDVEVILPRWENAQGQWKPACCNQSMQVDAAQFAGRGPGGAVIVPVH